MLTTGPSIRRASRSDLPLLQEIREAAFTPIFGAFKAALGELVYDVAQRHEDELQASQLDNLFDEDSPWQVFVLESEHTLVGFVSWRTDAVRGFGEIGLNAVHPEYGGRGFGTAMYEFALNEMRRAGMRVATVSTGADASHTSARRAYEKAGFNLSIPSVWLCQAL